jgi:hypothetical protein
MTGWAVRRELSNRGHEVSNEQLKLIAAWGLLSASSGRYAPDSVDRAAAVLEAEPQARPLFRRVVLLRGDFLRFPVPIEPLRRALIRLAPTIRRPMRKLRQVERAWAVMVARLSGRALAPPRRLLPASQWAEHIDSVPVETAAGRVAGWYAWARDILPAYAKEIDLDLSKIPLEERVLMTALLDTLGSTLP